MCKVVAYLVTDVMLVISLYLILYQFYCHFYIGTEFKTTNFLVTSTHLPSSFLSSLSGYIVSTTPIDALGKTNQ